MPDLAKRRSDHAIQALHDGMQAKLMSFLNQFHKQLALVDPALTNNFLLEVIFFSCISVFFSCFFSSLPFVSHCILVQVTKHYNNVLKPEMTQERLHVLSTAVVDAETKVSWLKLWNTSKINRESSNFPTGKTLSDRNLLVWLHKATFWAQVLLLTLIFGFFDFKVIGFHSFLQLIFGFLSCSLRKRQLRISIHVCLTMISPSIWMFQANQWV